MLWIAFPTFLIKDMFQRILYFCSSQISFEDFHLVNCKINGLVCIYLYLTLLKNFAPRWSKTHNVEETISGKLFWKSIKAYLAFSIFSPYIDPLLSSRKIYYPLASFTSVSVFFPFNEALRASSRLRWENLGINDRTAVEAASVFPKAKLGRW